MPKNRKKNVTILWESYWKKGGTQISVKLEKHYSSYLIYKILKKEINNQPMILEIGAGASRSSLLLGKFDGVTPFLLDTSISAVKISKKIATFHDIKAYHIIGDAFMPPFKDYSFDVVWSGGLLEHFSNQEGYQLIKNMFRLIKKGGKVIAIVPNRNAVVYNLSRQIAQKLGTWPYGFEEPMIDTDFKPIKGAELKVYSAGMLHQIGAVSVLPIGGFLSWIIERLLRFLLRRKYEEIDLLNSQHGHHLIAVYKKVNVESTN